MDINLLVLSAGNSRVAIGAFVAGELAKVVRVANSDREACVAQARELWAMVSGKENAAIAGASVAPSVSEPLEHAIAQGLGQKIEWVGRELELPARVLTETPSETGADRVLNIAAAYEQMQKACVVVDAGTAVTIDCCDDTGAFLGGAILPGASMMLAALHEKTAKLPSVSFERPTDAPFGASTRQAMLQGIYHGIRGAVKELVEQYATKLGQWPDIIATGGDAKTLFEGWELIHAVSPDLTLYGIALAYAEHHIKHRS